MYVQVEKLKEIKSRAITNPIVQKRSNIKQSFGLVGNLSHVVAKKVQINGNNISANQTPKNIKSGLVIQKKDGFEFETGNEYQWMDEQGKWYSPGRVKGEPMYKGKNFVIEGDTSLNAEVITEPLRSSAQVQEVIGSAIAVLKSVNDAIPDANGRKVMSGGGWTRPTAFKKDLDEEWPADAQATQGVKINDLSKYLDTHLSHQENNLRRSRKEKSGINYNESSQVTSFIDLIIQIVADFTIWNGMKSEEGPKNAQAYMLRNSYSSIYNAMSAPSRLEFRALFFNENNEWRADNPVTKATGKQSGDLMIPKHYKDSGGEKVERVLTLKAWIDQILDETDHRDTMSPPIGWNGGDYGMGAIDDLDQDKNNEHLVLIEYRKTDNRQDLDDGKNLSMHGWIDWASSQRLKILETYDQQDRATVHYRQRKK